MVIIAILFVNCSYLSSSDEVKEKRAITPPAPVSVAQEVVVKEVKEKVTPKIEIGAIEVVESATVDDKTLVADERKVEKRIERDVPSSCDMWSDGCNVCTRKGHGSKKALCTVYPACHNRVLSCLKWQ